MAELNTSLPILAGCHHITFDGCHYFCTVKCRCEIIKLELCCKEIQRFCTCREYDCICYDVCDHCFWASSKGCRHKLFKLNCEMQEIDCIEVCNPCYQGEITGISYKCCSDTLLVSFPSAVYEVEKPCGKSRLLYSSKKDLILGVLSLCPGMIITVLRGHCYVIEVFDGCNQKINSHVVKGCNCPKNILFNPCTGDANFNVLIRNKLGYCHLLRYCVSSCELGFCPCSCNYNLCDQCCCDTKHGCADVLESIALMETALSHILNAEGEKIQKALAATDDLEQILCVNREVNKTIVNATHLEHVLHAKLSTLCDCGICEESL